MDKDSEEAGHVQGAEDAVVAASPVQETGPGDAAVSRASSMTNASRRKPVPPPKDASTLPKWVVAQTTKKVKRRPVSMASYTLTLSDHSNGSVGEGTSAPRAENVDDNPKEDTTPTTDHPPLQVVPEDESLPRFIPVLATTKQEIPLRRVNSLPPYGPGPTNMHILPKDLTPSRPRTIRRKPSTIRKRWRPSPGTVRKTVTVRMKKLQDMTNASFRPRPLSSEVTFGKTFGSVKRVAFQSFGRRMTSRRASRTMQEPAMVEETVLSTGDPNPPKPPATYKSFLKRAKTEPAILRTRTPDIAPPLEEEIPRVPRKPFNAGKWIDEHFDLLQSPPQRRSQTMPASPTSGPSPPRWRRFTPARRTPTIETDEWIVVPRPRNRTIKVIQRQGRYVGNAVVKGWGRVVVVGTSVGQLVAKVRRRKNVGAENPVEERQDLETTVRQVMTVTANERENEENRPSVEESVSEQFVTDDDIMEAETVPAEAEHVEK